MLIPGRAYPPVRVLALAGLVASVLVVLGPQLFAAEGSSPASGMDRLRQQRKQAAHRKRRIIFNNDGNSIVYKLKDKEVSVEALLADRTTGLIGTHVDSIFYCPWSAGLGLCTHKSEIAEPFYAKTGVFGANMTKEFHDKGLDPLEIMVDFCKAKDIEIFMSMRMNDIHDSYPQWSELLSQFKKDHPELLFGTREQGPRFGKWSGLDYGRAEVRDRAAELLEDVCKRYDVDGIELDFMRHIPHFKCNAKGDDCTQKERDMMTGLLRRIREMTERAGLERNRPILVAVRIPASVSCCEAVGLDVTRWLEYDLVDILIPGEWEFSPWEKWVALGHKHGVPVYPCLSWTGSKKRKGLPSMQKGIPMGSLRSRATNVWHSGADGIQTFNLFDPASSVWRELGDPKVLAGLDKDYFPHGYWRSVWKSKDVRDPGRFVDVPTPPYAKHPAILEPGQSRDVDMLIGDDLSGHDKSPADEPRITLSLGIAELTGADTLAVTLNGHAVSNGSVKGNWVSYTVGPELFQKGNNSVLVTNRAGADRTIVFRNVHVRIDYPQ